MSLDALLFRVGASVGARGRGLDGLVCGLDGRGTIFGGGRSWGWRYWGWFGGSGCRRFLRCFVCWVYVHVVVRGGFVGPEVQALGRRVLWGWRWTFGVLWNGGVWCRWCSMLVQSVLYSSWRVDIRLQQHDSLSFIHVSKIKNEVSCWTLNHNSRYQRRHYSRESGWVPDNSHLKISRRLKVSVYPFWD
ncbi:hypothetical protein B0J11DRAFT_519098 [Dendryphion nanum]|uniref:Uncharacterized protein n=1 Tax=Dendryphion nanum TaxID=256645 RepID=A0A9P9EDN3_9PLEO|nr:hypothetical protein B0J11DRAFT_519098 [Dendryphion nanum]